MASKKSYLEKAAGEMTKFFTGAEAEADRQEDTRKPLNDTEKAVLEKYNSGMTVQNDIAESIGKDKAGVSRALKRIREEYPELLQEPEFESGSAAETPQAEPQKPAEAMKQPEPIESKEGAGKTAGNGAGEATEGKKTGIFLPGRGKRYYMLESIRHSHRADDGKRGKCSHDGIFKESPADRK